MGYGTRIVSKESILSKISDLEIFNYYIDNFKKVNRKFCSELREDSTPSCVVGYHGGRYWYRDFGEHESLDCFSYVQKKYGIGFLQALDLINKDFNLGFTPKLVGWDSSSIHSKPLADTYEKSNLVEEGEKSKTIILTRRRKWSHADKNYWFGQYGITRKDLEAEDIYPIEAFSINGVVYKAETVAYGYYLGKCPDSGIELWKIYQPYSSRLKWICNAGAEVLQGDDYFLGRGIITKSYKDVIVLKKLGYYSAAPQSESGNLPEYFLRRLRKSSVEAFVLFDNDRAGRKAAKKISYTTGLPIWELPEDMAKDPSDFVKKYGYDKLGEKLEKAWERLFGQSLSPIGKIV